MLSTEVEMLPFELLLMDAGSLLAGYVLFRSDKKLSLGYIISQVFGTALILISFLLRLTPYEVWGGAILVVGFLAKLGIFPFLWVHTTISRSKAIAGLVICSQLSIVLLISALNRELMNQNALLVFGLFASFFSALSAIYDKKTKSSIASIIAAQTASIFVGLSVVSLVSVFIAVLSDLLAKFTILLSEERKDDIAQIVAAVYLAELPPFPTFSEEFEIAEMSMSIGVVRNVIGLLMMFALLTHRVKGGKSLGARAVGAILLVVGIISLLKKI